MKITALAVALALPLTTQLQAQTVGGHVVIRSGPVTAGVVFGPRYVPVRPVYGPQVVVVGPPYYGDDYWGRRGYRRVTVWYDADRDCYYDHADPRFGYRPVVVYSRGGRYFREFPRDYRYDRRDDRDWGHHGHAYGHDRHDDGRYDHHHDGHYGH